MFSASLLFAADPPPEGPGMFLQFAPLFFILFLFVFMIWLPMRRQQKQQRDMLNNQLKKNDRVLTNAGIIGTVTNIKDEEVTLRLEEGKMRILKSTIARILGDEEAVKDAGIKPA